MDHLRRRARLLEAITGRRLQGMVITHMPNIRYLCGFTGTSGVLAVGGGSRPRSVLFTDGRYTAQAREEVSGARVVIVKGAALAAAVQWLGESLPKGARAGFEADHMTVSLREALGRLAPKGLRLVPLSGLVERLRMVKEPAEIDRKSVV